MNIDTLSIARELRAADLPDGQADAIAAAIGKVVGEATATKADLREVKLELEAKIEGVQTKIEAVQTKLIMWFIGTQLAFVALLGAIIKF